MDSLIKQAHRAETRNGSQMVTKVNVWRLQAEKNCSGVYHWPSYPLGFNESAFCAQWLWIWIKVGDTQNRGRIDTADRWGPVRPNAYPKECLVYEMPSNDVRKFHNMGKNLFMRECAI